ncbi:MAG: site-2 protease family protein [Candidatus Geothermarchaeales archaeon]
MDKAEGEEARERRIEFKPPMLIVRTQAFMRLYDRLGSLRVSRPISWATLIGMPIVAGFGLYLISITLLTLLTVPEAREAGRELGPRAYILLPGVNPYLPILYGWIGVVVAIAVHEGAHGVIARSLGFRVKSSGLLFFLAIPMGAFVDVDEEQMGRAKAKDSVRVLAAGPGANIAIALICIVGVLVITSGLSPAVDGLRVVEVMEGMPAEEAGLMVGDVITRVDDKPVTTLKDFAAVLEGKGPGDVVRVTVARGERWRERHFASVELTEYEGRAVLGVILSEMLIGQRLRTYQRMATESPFIHFLLPTLAQGLVPFSDALSAFYTHALGEHWHVLANIFFWVWFVNVNLAIFNALPIYPLDGGQTFRNVLKSVLGRRVNKKVVTWLTTAVTIAMACAIAMMIALPYVI